MEREDFIKNWLEGKISPQELDKKLREESNFSDLKEIIESSSRLNVPQKETKEQAWKKLSDNIQGEKKSTPVAKLNPWITLSIAASLILLIVSYFILNSSENIIVPRGEHLTYTLPDGSSVILNADSKISFKEPFKLGEIRKVELQGEAFFKVEPGGKFEVHGPNGTVTVLGTSFNVNQRNANLEVACFTGVVEVTSIEGQRVTLKAGEFTQTKNDSLVSPAPFDEGKIVSWREGDFHFENEPLEKVLTEIERQFNVEIEYQTKPGRFYTGYFNNKNLDEALQLVFQPMKLRYRKEGNKIIVEP